jgi:hypothetical protein
VTEGPFEFSTVLHLLEPVGTPAHDLAELRSGIQAADSRTLLHLALEPLLRDPHAEETPAHGFTEWCAHVLLLPEAAERLEAAGEWRGRDLEVVRRSLLEVLDELGGSERARARAPHGLGFRLHRWHTLTLVSTLSAGDAEALVEAVAALGPSEFFYHFYEARALNAGPAEDLGAWLAELGAAARARAAREVPAGGKSLANARGQLLRRWRHRGIAARLVERVALPEAARRGEAREAVAQLMRPKRKEPGSW